MISKTELGKILPIYLKSTFFIDYFFADIRALDRARLFLELLKAVHPVDAEVSLRKSKRQIATFFQSQTGEPIYEIQIGSSLFRLSEDSEANWQNSINLYLNIAIQYRYIMQLERKANISFENTTSIKEQFLNSNECFMDALVFATLFLKQWLGVTPDIYPEKYQRKFLTYESKICSDLFKTWNYYHDHRFSIFLFKNKKYWKQHMDKLSNSMICVSNSFI